MGISHTKIDIDSDLWIDLLLFESDIIQYTFMISSSLPPLFYVLLQ